MNFEDLTLEQKEMELASKTPEELLALAKEKGIELTDKEIEEISGGGCDLLRLASCFSRTSS